jgi:hypothetical protein
MKVFWFFSCNCLGICYPPSERLTTKAQRHEVASKEISSCHPSWLCAFVVNRFLLAHLAVGMVLFPR